MALTNPSGSLQTVQLNCNLLHAFKIKAFDFPYNLTTCFVKSQKVCIK